MVNGFEHDPEEAARVRVRLLRELAANRESLRVSETHVDFQSFACRGDAARRPGVAPAMSWFTSIFGAMAS